MAVWFVVFFFSCQAAVRLSEEDASLKDDLVQPECAHRPPRRVHGCLAKAPPGLGGHPILLEYRLSLLGAFDCVCVQSVPSSAQ